MYLGYYFLLKDLHFNCVTSWSFIHLSVNNRGIIGFFFFEGVSSIKFLDKNFIGILKNLASNVLTINF